MRILAWGTYDLGKPRVRILLRGLRENDVEVHECHRDVWQGVEDKSQVKGGLSKLRFALRWLFAYPGLIGCYLRSPRHDVVLVGYLGQLDVLVIWPFAKLRGVPIVWDAFLSLYNTVVEDRRLVGPGNPLAKLLYGLEWLACRAADRVVLDTWAHAEYFMETYHLPREKMGRVFVGAEPEAFPLAPPKPPRSPDAPPLVLFYGQFIPLHGIETIIEAARLLKDEAIDWIIIGQGQEAEGIRSMLQEEPLPRLKWIPWVPYDSLLDHIASADICLGIFGGTEKAARVIPNKVFQILSCGKPLITADTPAVRELLEEGPDVNLVPSAVPQALASRIRDMTFPAVPASHEVTDHLRNRMAPKAIGQQLIDEVDDVKKSRKAVP